jgi:hypothetical protein
MHALPATTTHTAEVSVVVPAVSAAGSLGGSAGGLDSPAAVAAPAAPLDPAPWLYRSEGFAEDLDTDPAHEPKPESPLLRWGLPMVALVGVVGLAAAFSLV